MATSYAERQARKLQAELNERAAAIADTNRDVARQQRRAESRRDREDALVESAEVARSIAREQREVEAEYEATNAPRLARERHIATYWDRPLPGERSGADDLSLDAMIARRLGEDDLSEETIEARLAGRVPTRRPRPNRSGLTRREREADAITRTWETIGRADAPGHLAELRALGSGMPYIGGYGVVFDVWTEIESFAEGHFLERIRPGAAAKSIQENGDRIKVMFQHGADLSTGEKPLCTPTITEDHNGVRYEGQLYDTVYCRELIPALEGGQLGASFKFRVIAESFDDDPGPSDYNPKGLPQRSIEELELFEMGPVVFGAYPTATAGINYPTP